MRNSTRSLVLFLLLLLSAYQTVHAAAPTFNSSSIQSITGTGFTLRVNPNQAVTIYYVVTQSATQPTITQIKAGQNHLGAAADAANNFAAATSVNTNHAISGLTSETAYYVHFIAENGGAEQSTIQTATATTLDITAPAYTSSSIQNNTTGNSFTLRVQYTETSTIYYVVTTSSTAPTATQVKAGQDNTGSAAFIADNYGATANTDANDPISGLSEVITYYVYFIAEDAAGNQSTVHSENATTPDTTAPTIASVIPIDDTTVPTDTQLQITFSENVVASATTTSTSHDTDITITDGAAYTQYIDRASASISFASNVVTVDLSSLPALATNTTYTIKIGDKVFKDGASNNFAGISSTTAWNFTTASGVTLTTPTAAACAGVISPLGDIVITEVNKSDFQGTASTSKTIVLKFDNGGFVFQPGTSGVSITPAAGKDIAAATVTSITYSQATFTITFTSGNVTNDLDVLTISGLKVSSDGSSGATPGYILKDATSTLAIQGIVNGTTHLGTVNNTVGASSPPANVTFTSLGATTNNAKYCYGTDLSGEHAISSGSTPKWYADASLTTLLSSATSPLLSALGVNSSDASVAAGNPKIYTVYVTQTNASSCESTSSLAITITINPIPVADAGLDPSPVCFGSTVSIGGSPTLNTPAGPGPYQYAWTGPGTISPNNSTTATNPTITPPDPGATDQSYNYSVIVTNTSTGCASPVNGLSTVAVMVKNTAGSVSITKPTQSDFTVGQSAVDLEGLPTTGGVFSGTGVVNAGGGAYKFDPTIAGSAGSPYTITYTAQVNGCSKSTTKQLYVYSAYNVINNLGDKYCSQGEGLQGPLTLTAAFVTQIQNYVNTWNTVYVPNYGYGPITFNPAAPVIRNYYGSGVTGTSPNLYFNPSNYTKPCSTCDYAYVYVYLPFTTSNQYPYNTPDVPYGGEFVTINPVPNVYFSGLDSGLPTPTNFCNNNQNFTLTANANGGQFYIDNQLATISSTSLGLTDPDGAGPTAVFNPLNVAPGPHTIRFDLDPGTVGSTGQACKGSFSINITVNSLPSVSFTTAPSPAQVFCNDAATVSLAANQTSNILLTGAGVADQNGGIGIFNPTLAFQQKEAEANATLTIPQNVDIIATYTDPSTGCKQSAMRTVEVRPIPANTLTITPNNPTNTYCYEDANVQLSGGQTNGRYAITYVGTSRPTDNINNKDHDFDPSVYFDNSVSSGANPISTLQYSIAYTTNDVAYPVCTNSKTFTFNVAPKIPVTIAGIINNEIYCANEKARVLELTPAGGSLSINGGPPETIVTAPDPTNPTVQRTTFTFNRPAGGDFSMIYSVITGSNCTNTDTKAVKLLPSPVASFTVNARCDGDLINYDAAANPNNKTWSWTFVDSLRTGQNLQHKFPSPGSYNVKLKVAADPFSLGGGNFLVCKDSIERVQVVGAIPIVAFDFTKVCEGDNTVFEIGTTNNVPINQVAWEFGDGDLLAFGQGPQNIPAGTNGGRTAGTFLKPTHRYSTMGTVNVKVTGKTAPEFGACADDETRQVSILKNLAPTPLNPYLMVNENGSDGFWVKEDRNGNSTWEFAAPNGTVIHSAEKSWVTNAAGVYKANDQSYMNSPCFDLSEFKRPVFSIRYWSDTKPQADGAVVQFSTDGGINWSTLGGFIGDFSTGLNWYNAQGISASPGGQSFWAWSRELDKTWSLGKHTLDVIPVAKRTQVRFRVAFASTSRGADQTSFASEGFAFNEVNIEERNRVVLAENFTNNNVATAATNDQDFLIFKQDSPSEVVKLQYHIGLPQGDEINAQNTADPNARAAFYGLTNTNALVPKAYLDGFSNGNFLGTWVNNYFSLRSLVASPVQLTITNPAAPDNKSLGVSVNVKATSAITSGRLALFIAVIEKNIGSDGFVMRKMLPTAAGSEIKLPMALNQEITITPDAWEVKNINNPSDLGIVAFVQDLDTKDVIQSAYLASPSNLPTVITGVNESSSGINIYPNPANRDFTIQIPSNWKQGGLIKVSDQIGKVVHETSFNAGSKTKTINTRDFAEGLYILKMESGSERANQKVIVVHQ